MKTIVYLLFISLIINLFSACPQWHAEYEEELFEENEKQHMLILHLQEQEALNRKTAVDSAINNYINKYNIKSAVSVCVYGKDFRDYWHSGLHSVQKLNETECTRNSFHYIYSISKTFVASKILLLEKAGSLSLNDTISDFFPNLCTDYNIANYINMDATIEELLTHKSGICDFTSNSKLYSENPFISNSEYDPLVLLKYIEHVKQGRGNFIYSSANYILLGKIIENVTGKSLQTVYNEDFLTPLNLSKTYITPPYDFDYQKICHPHVYPGTQLNLTGDTSTPIDLCTVFSETDFIKITGLSSWAAGGMLSNAGDIAKWGYNLFSENGIDELKDIREEMLDSVKNYEYGAENSFGYGCRKIFIDENHWLIGHYGRSFGSENLMFYTPDLDLCITILLSENQSINGKPDVDDLLKKLIKLFKM